jgi:hypothetical protein
MGSLEPNRSKIRKENEHVRKASPSRWRSVDSPYSNLQGLFYLIHGGTDESFILCKDMGGRQFLYCMTYTAGIEGGHRPNLEVKIQLTNLILLKLQLAHDPRKVDGSGYEIHTRWFACMNPDGWFV